MEHGAFSPAMTVALAAAAGILAQSLARHLRVPGIILLLAVGVVLGPDVLGWVRPGDLGPALFDIVGFAVAVILFEGGMNLSLRRLRREGRTIQRLVTLGAVVTTLGGMLAARTLMGWPWRISLLFGTLVVVTGPTVINPLLKRIKVQRQVSTVLEAEGVLIDALGAVVAVVALEVALTAGQDIATAPLDVLLRLGVGGGIGLVAGLGLAGLFKWRDLVPEGLENVFTLSIVLVVYQGANVVMPESGIAAVVAAGIVVGNARSHAQRGLLEFKEQLTVLLIGLLFVLLAADVRLEDVNGLGWGGAAVVGALVLLVRPLAVGVATAGSNLNVRQRAFIGWLAPRGIVAAAVASLFAAEMARQGMPGGTELRALVFLVIAATVLLAGLTGGAMARLLGLKRPAEAGWVILGANPLGRMLAGVLKDNGEEVVLVDANPDDTQAAQEAGLRVIYGNALEERTLHRAEVDTRSGAIGLTPNEEVNLLFVEKARHAGRIKRLYVSLKTAKGGVTPAMVHEAGAAVLFGWNQDVMLWSGRIRRGNTVVERWKLASPPSNGDQGAFGHDLQSESLLLPLAVRRDGRWRPAGDQLRLRPGEQALWLIHQEGLGRAHDWLHVRGWQLDDERPKAESEAAGPEPAAAPGS